MKCDIIILLGGYKRKKEDCVEPIENNFLRKSFRIKKGTEYNCLDEEENEKMQKIIMKYSENYAFYIKCFDLQIEI